MSHLHLPLNHSCSSIPSIASKLGSIGIVFFCLNSSLVICLTWNSWTTWWTTGTRRSAARSRLRSSASSSSGSSLSCGRKWRRSTRSDSSTTWATSGTWRTVSQTPGIKFWNFNAKFSFTKAWQFACEFSEIPGLLDNLYNNSPRKTKYLKCLM